MAILTGAIKNALQKGESLDQAIQSFINAGYSKEEVNKSINEINSQVGYKQEASPVINPVGDMQENKSKFKELPVMMSKINKKSYVLYIFIGIISILILIGAGLLGLYWNKLF